MATLTLLCEIPLDRGAKIVAQDEAGTEESNTRAFRLVYDTVVTDIRQPLNQVGLPAIGSGHPSNIFIECFSRQPIPQNDGFRHFIVICQYKVPPEGGFEENPLLTPWVVGTDVREAEFILEQDFTPLGKGLLVQNSAQDWFDPPLMETEYWHVLNMTKNIATYTLAAEFAVENTINKTAIQIAGFVFPIHSLWCTRYTTSGKQTQNGIPFYPLSVQFIFKPTYDVARALIHFAGGDGSPNAGDAIGALTVGGWDRAVVDQGFNHRPGSTPGTLLGIKPILDCSQKQTKVAKKLNGFGVQEGDPCGTPTQYDPVYLIFQGKEEFEFSTVLPAFPPDFP